MVVLVEVIRKAYLASIVPVIVNSVLDSHQLIVDIVAFVSKGDFPRSRLGEKQRGKILGAWVTRKMRTIAQFSIRDDDGADSQITEVAEPRSGVGSVVGSVVGVGSSLRNVETVTSPPAVEEAGIPDYTTLPTGISEMPATYESSIVESPPLPPSEEDGDNTPTDPRGYNHNDFPQSSHDEHARINDYDDPQNDPYLHEHSDLPLAQQHQQLHLANETEEYPEYIAYTANANHNSHDTDPSAGNHADASTFDFNPDPPPPPARYDNKPVLSQPYHQSEDQSYSRHRESALASLPSQQQPQQRYSSSNYASHYDNNNNNNNKNDVSHRGGSKLTADVRGGLHVANTADDDDNDEDASSADDWRRDALMQMNLARDGSKTGGRSREGTAGDRSGVVVAAGDYGDGSGGGGGYRGGGGRRAGGAGGGYDHAL